MSGTPSSGAGNGLDNGKTPKMPKTPAGTKKLIQGRLPFAAVDNKSPSAAAKANNNEIKPKEEEKIIVKATAPVTKEDENLADDDDVCCLDDSIKSVPTAESDTSSSSQSAMEVSGRDSNSEVNVSRASLDDSTKTPNLKKKGTPKINVSASKLAEREKKRLEKLKEKEDRDKKKLEEKAEKERLRKEKEEEKEAEKKRKEEEKRKKEEEREADKKKKEEEKKRKEEEKEAERKKKEDEKRKKEEEKEAEKKKKEEEEKKKKQRVSQVFSSFFTQKKTTPAKSDAVVTLAFPPFQVKENMKLAPRVRTDFDEARRSILDETLETAEEVEVSCRQFKDCKRVSGPTWPVVIENPDNDVECIDEDDVSVNKEDVIITVPVALPRRMRAKLLKFEENRRPAYWGTWRKPSQFVGPRRPFGKEPIMDYEVDSDDEWEEEVEPGESLTDSEGEGEEKEPADDYEVDNEFLVPHGYLSDEEGEKDEDERPLSPSTAKEQLKLKEEQFEKELKEKTRLIKPSLIGCCWEHSDIQAEAHLLKVLKQYEAVLLTVASFPVPVLQSELQLCTDGNGDSPSLLDESGNGRTGEKSAGAPKRFVNETDIPILIRQLHGVSHGKASICNEFLAYLERTRPEDKNVPSKSQILAKIGEIASWTKTNWMVSPEVLERYQLADLSSVNSWEYTTETKKRKQNKDKEEANPVSNKPIREEEGSTPPVKTARVSLMKKFAQPTPPAQPSPQQQDTSKVDDDFEQPSSSTPKAKKRVALTSFIPTSASKKSKIEPASKTPTMTDYIKRMSTTPKPAKIKSTKKSSDEAPDCIELE